MARVPAKKAAKKAPAKKAAAKKTAAKKTAAKKTAAKAAPARKAPARKAPVKRGARKRAGATPRMTVRHYCQGIGDSHLLTLHRPGGKPFRMLIDCGLHTIVTGGSDIIDDVASDILAQLNDDPLDVLVVTHEHWDHVSGFSTAKEIFAKIKVRDVWMAWTEKPGDPLAEELDKYEGQALAALAAVNGKLAGMQGLSRHMQGLRDGLDTILGFHFGAKGDKVRTARNLAANASGKSPEYLEPGSKPIEIAGVPGLRIFVLGPPRDKKMLRLEERKDEMYHFGSARPGWAFERALSAGFALDNADPGNWVQEMCPFQEHHGHDLDAVLGGRGDADVVSFVTAHYSGAAPLHPSRPKAQHFPDQDWRRIDADWLGIAADLALQLDQGVNNTSLVLAFEFDNERVVLFPGDAQIGSWLSWQDIAWTDVGVTAKDLLARTVYLKVAHHGSHNATPERVGLEQMMHPDLAAFIPVSKDDATKAKWHQMPFETILTRLGEKSAGRVLRADDQWMRQPGGAPPFPVPSGSIQGVRSGQLPQQRGYWVEVDIA
jgi:beta-lactamase superfamily II metal-dependent hydrolase